MSLPSGSHRSLRGPWVKKVALIYHRFLSFLCRTARHGEDRGAHLRIGRETQLDIGPVDVAVDGWNWRRHRGRVDGTVRNGAIGVRNSARQRRHFEQKRTATGRGARTDTDGAAVAAILPRRHSGRSTRRSLGYLHDGKDATQPICTTRDVPIEWKVFCGPLRRSSPVEIKTMNFLEPTNGGGLFEVAGAQPPCDQGEGRFGTEKRSTVVFGIIKKPKTTKKTRDGPDRS